MVWCSVFLQHEPSSNQRHQQHHLILHIQPLYIWAVGVTAGRGVYLGQALEHHSVHGWYVDVTVHSTLYAMPLLGAGTAMVTIGDSQAATPGSAGDPPSTVQGDILALLSAMLYASYTLAIKLLLPHDGKVCNYSREKADVAAASLLVVINA